MKRKISGTFFDSFVPFNFVGQMLYLFFLLFLLITKCERRQSFLENTNLVKVHPILNPTSTIYRYTRIKNKNILNSHNKCQCTEFPKWINCGCRQYICIYHCYASSTEVCYRFFLFWTLMLFAIKCDVVHILDSWILIIYTRIKSK